MTTKFIYPLITLRNFKVNFYFHNKPPETFIIQVYFNEKP